MDKTFLAAIELVMDYKQGTLARCMSIKDVCLKVYEGRKNGEDVIKVLTAWEDWKGGFTEETTKVELPYTIWSALDDLG